MPPVCHNFVKQLTFRRPKLSRFSAFAAFYPALREHIENTHKQLTNAIAQIIHHESVQTMTDSHIKQFLLTEMENAQIFVDALGELSLRYAYNVLLTGKTTYVQFITRLDVLLASHSFMHRTVDEWLDKPLVASIVEVLYKLVHPSTGIMHSFLSGIFSGKLALIIQNVEKVLNTMHIYTTFDDCIKAIFSTGKSVLFTPFTLQLAKKKIRSALGDAVWTERDSYYQLLRSALLIPKELMECVVVEISAQHNVDNELFKCFPYYYTPDSDLSTIHKPSSLSRFWTRKSSSSADSTIIGTKTRRRGIFGKLLGRRSKKASPSPSPKEAPSSLQSGGAELTSDPYTPLIPSLQNALQSSKAPSFQMPKDFLSSIQQKLGTAAPEAAALMRSLQQQATPSDANSSTKIQPVDNQHTSKQRRSSRRSKMKTESSPEVVTEQNTREDTTNATISRSQLEYKEPNMVSRVATEPATNSKTDVEPMSVSAPAPKVEPQLKAEQDTQQQPPYTMASKREPTENPASTQVSLSTEPPQKAIPEALLQAWKHQREAETNTREVLQKLSVADLDAGTKQTWWTRMRSRMYTFSHKKENIEFLGLSMLQFSPMQLLCAYLTPVHLHYEGWSDQLTIVAMMYHLQTLDVLPSLVHLGSNSYCSHVKNIPIPKTLSSSVQSFLTNRHEKCVSQSKQLLDDYCTTVESLREEAYPVQTLLKTKKCASKNSRRDTKRRT